MKRWPAGRVRLLFVLALILVVSTALVALNSARRGSPRRGASGRAVTAATIPGLSSSTPDAGRSPTPTPGPAATSRARRPLVPDADGRVRIPLAEPMPGRLPAAGVPQSWELREFTGKANVELARSELGPALHLRSEQTSFVLYRDVVIDLEQLPMLSWSWKVSQLPTGGDVRQPTRDDQAAQVYVVFPRWPAPRTNSDVIGYVWDTTAPVGTRLVSHKASNVRVLVLESGAAGLGVWRRQERNVSEDYVALFGRRPPRVGSLAVMVDANDTASAAEFWIADLTFSRS